MKNTSKFQKNFQNFQHFEGTQKLIIEEEQSCQVQQLFPHKLLEESVLIVETNILNQEKLVTMETLEQGMDVQPFAKRN